MTKNDLINEVAYELNDFLSKEQIDRMKITLYVKLQDFELAEIKQLPMTMEHDNEWLMQRYCVDGVAAGLHAGTIRSYIGIIKKFFEFVNKNYKYVTAQDITDYLAIRSYRDHISHNYKSTIYRYLCTFFSWAFKKRHIQDNIIDGVDRVKQVKKKKVRLTDEEVETIRYAFAELLNDSDREITGGKMRFVSVRFGTREESEEAVRSGKAEGALIILKGFGAGLESGEEAFLEYRASADASSAQAAEEIIGGRAVALRSRLRSADYAEKLLNRGLTEKELSELEVAAKEYYNEQVGAVRFERIGGSVEKADSSVFGALRARFSGIGAFAVLTLLLTLGSWTGSNAARAAEKRLAAEKGGVSISFWSNFLALFICGIAMYAVMYIAAAAAGRNSPNGHELLAAGCYLFCASALALVVGGADISGRMNLAAPFIAFATSLLGGCFADTAARGGLFAKLALLTPQGLCIAGADGSVACIAVLAGAGVVLLALKRAALRVKFAERR